LIVEGNNGTPYRPKIFVSAHKFTTHRICTLDARPPQKRWLPEMIYAFLDQLSEGMSNRDLKNSVSLAQRLAVGRAIDNPDLYDLTMDELMSAIPDAATSRQKELSRSSLPKVPIF
jgi:hypothetical protein